MPNGLLRLQGGGDTHFITFSCYQRHALLCSERNRRLFELALEAARKKYQFQLFGYVVMPEHVHLLLSEPQNGALASSIQAIKQSSSRKVLTCDGHFWQARYYDFNVFTAKKHVEKLRYIHRNPVLRGLVEKPKIGLGVASSTTRPGQAAWSRLHLPGGRSKGSAVTLYREFD
jgi:putative transposase